MDSPDKFANGPPEPELPPNCNHDQWTLACERCFVEATQLAAGNVRAEDQQRAHEHTLNGGVLFGWHVITVLADMEMGLTQIANETLDLKKRELATNTIHNIHNLSVYLAKVCTDTKAMGNAIQSAAALAQAMRERIEAEKATPIPEPASVSKLVLTDVL